MKVKIPRHLSTKKEKRIFFLVSKRKRSLTSQFPIWLNSVKNKLQTITKLAKANSVSRYRTRKADYLILLQNKVNKKRVFCQIVGVFFETIEFYSSVYIYSKIKKSCNAVLYYCYFDRQLGLQFLQLVFSVLYYLFTFFG